MGLAAISVDLDTLRHYLEIHALPNAALPGTAVDLVYARALPRFLELFAELKLPATLFAIGVDVEGRGEGEALAAAAARGCEIGNHSHRHLYGLSRLPEAQLHDEIAHAEAAIASATGVRPRGFRAPGYTLSGPLYRVLEQRGYLYDSSTFPAAPYWAAKAAVMGAMALLRRPSRAILDSPRVLLAPALPYRPDPARPYREGSGGVLELPISVGPYTRLPFIGTLVTTAPWPLVRALYRTLKGAPLLNFELHGLDLLSAEDGISAALVRRQPDLRIPWSVKRERLLQVFSWLAQDFQVVTLAEVGERWPSLPGAAMRD